MCASVRHWHSYVRVHPRPHKHSKHLYLPWSTTWFNNYIPSRQTLSPYRLQSIETRTVTALARTCLKSKGEPCHCVYTVLVNPTFIIFYLYILGGRVVSGQCCPSATLWPLLALLPRRPDTVGLLSQDPAPGQAFSQVKGRGMKWWCHRGCWRVTWKVGGGPSRGDSVTH